MVVGSGQGDSDLVSDPIFVKAIFFIISGTNIHLSSRIR